MNSKNKQWRHNLRKIAILYLVTMILSTIIVTPALAVPPDQGAQPAQDNVTLPENTETAPTQPDAIDQKQSEAKKVVSEIKSLDLELEIATEAYNKAKIQLDETIQTLEEAQTKLDEAEEKYDSRKSVFDERVSVIYKNSQTNTLEVILNARNFTDFIVRVSFLAKIGLQDVFLLSDIGDAKEEVQTIKNELIALRDQQLAAEEELENERATVETKLIERRIVLESVSGEILQMIQKEEERRAREAAALLDQAKSELTNYSPKLSPVVVNAFSYIGIPYRWGGELPEEGLDCSGFVMYLFAQYGVRLPHSSQMQSNMGMPVEDALKPGDLVFFGNPVHHVGMYVGADYFIHAPRTGDVIKISRLSQRNDFVRARRFPLQIAEEQLPQAQTTSSY